MLKKLFIFILLLALVVSICLPLATNFLKPLLKERFLNAVESRLGGEIELSEFDISLLRGIIFLKGFKAKNPQLIKYYSSVAADEIVLDIDLPFMILRRDLVFQRIFLKNFTFRIRNKERPLSSAEAISALHKTPEAISASRRTPKAEVSLPKDAFNELYVRRLSIENSEFIFEDYSVTPSPIAMEIININGRFEKLYAQLRDDNILRGKVHLDGQLNSIHEGSLEIDGSFAKRGDDVDFDLNLDLAGINLIIFSPYYSQTSFMILKEAKVDLHSKASCQKNQLNAYQNVRIYDIELDDIAPTDEDMLFSLPAKTVIEFFKDLKGDVKFDFKLVGTINDPKFDAGPLVQKLLSEALQEQIMARLRDLPREVIKISEKAIKEGLEGKEFEQFEKLKKNIKGIGKKFKKLID